MKRILPIAVLLLAACAMPPGYTPLAPSPTYGAVAGGTLVAAEATRSAATSQALAATGDAYSAIREQSTADAVSTQTAATAAAGDLSLALTRDSATAIAVANATGTAVQEHIATQTATAQAFVDDQHRFETEQARIVHESRTYATATAIIAGATRSQDFNQGRMWITLAALAGAIVVVPFLLAQGLKRWLESRAVKNEAEAEATREKSEAQARAIEREAEAKAWEIEQRARNASLRRIGNEIIALIGNEPVRWAITAPTPSPSPEPDDDIPLIDEPSPIVVHTISGNRDMPRYPAHVQAMLDFLGQAANIAPDRGQSTFIPSASELNAKANITRKQRQPLVNILKSLGCVRTEPGGEAGGTYLRGYGTLDELMTAIRNGQVELPQPPSDN